jgi:tight adherence protein B
MTAAVLLPAPASVVVAVVAPVVAPVVVAAVAPVVVAVLVVATAWTARQAVRSAAVAGRLGSMRPIRGGPPVLVSAATGLAESLWRAAGARRDRRRAGADLPVALEAMARSLRSGATVHRALEDAIRAVDGIVRAGLQRVMAATARGQPLADALAGPAALGADPACWPELAAAPAAPGGLAADLAGVPGARLAVNALAVAADTGGPQAAALDGVATTLRQRLAVQAEAWALGAQARLSAVVIAAAPLVFAALASAADRGSAEFLLGTPLGLAMLAVGLALDIVGAIWMGRLTRVPAAEEPRASLVALTPVYGPQRDKTRLHR